MRGLFFVVGYPVAGTYHTSLGRITAKLHQNYPLTVLHNDYAYNKSSVNKPVVLLPPTSRAGVHDPQPIRVGERCQHLQQFVSGKVRDFHRHPSWHLQRKSSRLRLKASTCCSRDQSSGQRSIRSAVDQGRRDPGHVLGWLAEELGTTVGPLALPLAVWPPRHP